MAKHHITPMGKHKPLGSSWKAMDMAYSHAYQPEQRPEFRCYVIGQQANMQAAYDAHKQAQARHERLLLLKQKMLDKGLL